MENNVNYEKLTKSLVYNTNVFLEKPIVIIEETNDSVSIEFINKNLIVKEIFSGILNNEGWRRLYFNMFKSLIK